MRSLTKQIVIISLVVLAMLLLGGTLWAQNGGGFDLSWSTLDGGGGTSQGGSFSLSGTIGQPDAARSQGGAFALQSGFWVGLCRAPASVDAGIGLVGSSVQLAWNPVPAATSYNIYRGANDPYFLPGPGLLHGTTPVSPWIDPDPNAAGDPAVNHTYVVRAANPCGESADSRRMGEFDFAIVPGT